MLLEKPINCSKDSCTGDRQITCAAAIREALDLCLAANPAVFLIGEGVPDPKGIFGTTVGLREKYGPQRVQDMPLSENGMTGVAIGTCLAGLRPVMVHQRVDFALLAIDQIVNNAAKWFYMHNGQASIPMVIRMIVGRGWGEGPQHAQSLQAMFAHVPGLKVVMPTTAFDAKGLLIASIEDNNPVIFLEYRWLHNVTGEVPAGYYRVPLGEARLVREGEDLTFVSSSYMTLEAIRAAELLSEINVSVDVIDLRTIRPLDSATIMRSVRKTGRLVVADTGWTFGGIGAEIIAQVCEQMLGSLKAPPRRVALPDVPCPSSPALARHYYPRSGELICAAAELLGIESNRWQSLVCLPDSTPIDVPDRDFAGPF